MTPEVKKRIEQIRQGIVRRGIRKLNLALFPTNGEWDKSANVLKNTNFSLMTYHIFLCIPRPERGLFLNPITTIRGKL